MIHLNIENVMSITPEAAAAPKSVVSAGVRKRSGTSAMRHSGPRSEFIRARNRISPRSILVRVVDRGVPLRREISSMDRSS